MRRELKKRGIKKLKVVYSQEKPIRPIEDMSISCRSHCICPPGAAHKCTEPVSYTHLQDVIFSLKIKKLRI